MSNSKNLLLYNIGYEIQKEKKKVYRVFCTFDWFGWRIYKYNRYGKRIRNILERQK